MFSIQKMLVLPIPQNNNEGVIPYRPSLSKLVQEYSKRLQKAKDLMTTVEFSQKSTLHSVLRASQSSKLPLDISVFKAPKKNIESVLELLKDNTETQVGPETIDQVTDIVDRLVVLVKQKEEVSEDKAEEIENKIETCKREFYDAIVPGKKSDAQETMLSMSLVTLVKLKCPGCTIEFKPFVTPSNYPRREDLYEIGRCILTKGIVKKLSFLRKSVSAFNQYNFMADVVISIGRKFVEIVGSSFALRVIDILQWAKNKGVDQNCLIR